MKDSPPTCNRVSMTTPSAEATALHTASRAEIDHAGVMEQLASYAPADWQQYSGSLHVINDYVGLFQHGEAPPDNEWHRALHELGEDRRQLANNADVVIREHIQQRIAHLDSARRELRQLIAALQDVEQAESDNEEAMHLVHLVMNLKDLAEFAEHPSPERVANILTKRYSYDALIERGIENLANYQFMVVLASHGVASKQELQSRLGSAAQEVGAAAEALQFEYHLHGKAEEYYAWPAHQ